jgi:hypothetical protein
MEFKAYIFNSKPEAVEAVEAIDKHFGYPRQGADHFTSYEKHQDGFIIRQNDVIDLHFSFKTTKIQYDDTKI